MAIKQKHLYWNTDDEFQEYFDAGEEGLLKGIRNYDTNKNFKISTYLFCCISHEILKVVNKNNAKKRKNIYGDNISLSQKIRSDFLESMELGDLLVADTNIEEEFEKQEIIKKLLYEVEHLSSLKDVKIIKQHYGIEGINKPLRQIAQEMNCSVKAVVYRRDKALGILKKKLEEIW